jgi:SAM-dependent methyltransferase
MRRELLNILACPKCKAELALTETNKSDDEILVGELLCAICKKSYPITGAIPRFVEPDNYASSFGYQWNLFRKEQIDSHNGTTLSADRFWAETGWTRDELEGKWILDAGCGAGRFLDVSSSTEANVVGIDISSAIDAARKNLDGRANAHFVQASIYELPFRDETFDRCYCIGVIQHTPDPSLSLKSIAYKIKKDGELAVTIYERRRWWTRVYSKYWFRPVTKRMSKETLLKLIKGVMPVAFPITDVLFRVPVLGRAFMFVIPVANYVHEKQLSRKQRYDWAILDTFDMLSPQFDQPMTEPEAADALKSAGVDSKRHSYDGLNLVGHKK